MMGDNEQTEIAAENKKHSFLSKARQKRFVKFVVVSTAGWGINELIVFLMMLLLNHFYTQDVLFAIWFLDVEKILTAAAVAIVIVMVYNYIINKIWTFKKQEQLVDFATLPQFLKFALVGASGTVVNLGLVHLFAVIIGWNDYLATTIGFITSVITNFILNDIWTFNPKFGKPKKVED